MLELAVERDGLTEAFHQFERLIHNTVHGVMARFGGKRNMHASFLQRYGWDYDELFAMASLYFVEAYHKFEPDRGNSQDEPAHIRFALWMTYYIDRALRDKIRTQAKRATKLKPTLPEELGKLYCKPSLDFNVELFLRGMGRDSQTLVRIVLSMPGELIEMAEERGGQPRNYRKALRTILLNAGWCSTHITGCFTEIAQALSR